LSVLVDEFRGPAEIERGGTRGVGGEPLDFIVSRNCVSRLSWRSYVGGQPSRKTQVSGTELLSSIRRL
jgi:hypothetical protein